MPRISLSILILFLLSAGTISALVGNQNLTIHHPQSVRQAIPARDTHVGFDCGLGTTSAVLNSTGFPVAPIENGQLSTPQTQCTWIGDAGQTASGSNDGTVEPLVGDLDESLSLLSPGVGGGFTANVVVFQNSTASIDGFDFQVTWNTAVLRLVEFDQTGLAWRPFILETPAQTIDNTHGVAELAQVIQGTISNNVTIFRLRFDIVGIGISSLHIADVGPGLASPGQVVHSVVDSSFDSESYYDPGHSLNWNASFQTVPTPPTPGSPTTFTASATCPGCSAPFSYSWDFSSANTNPPKQDATGQTITITAPPVTLNRVTLNITDNASHTVTVTQRVPLVVGVRSAPSVSTGSSTTFTGLWLGGNPNYGLSWRICPGLSTNKAVCSNPFPSAQQQSGQANNQSATFNYSGLYTVGLTVSDSGSNSAKGSTQLNVTGTPAAYSVVLSSQTNSSGGVTFTASAVYASTYPTSFRSSQFSYMFDFGDFTIRTITGTSTVFVQHAYSTAGTFPVKVTVKETSSNAPSQIVETAQETVFTTTSSFDYSIGLSPSNGSTPPGGSVSTLVTLNTLFASPENVRLKALFTISGASVTFNTTSGTPPFSSTMVISTTAATPPETYSIIVQANSTSGIVHQTLFTLQVGTIFNEPIIGVWSTAYKSANITDTSLIAGSKFHVQINVTGAPFTGWNGYEFALYYDQRYINASSFDIFTGTLFGNNAFQAPGTFNGPGALRLSVVDEGALTADSGLLVDITFTVVSAGGVSPLVLAAGMAETGNGASASGSCPSCPTGAPNWSRLLAGFTVIGVGTSDGYFKNEASSSGPVPQFTYSPVNPSQGAFVTFNATGSFDPDNAGASNSGILTYYWDFGDQSNAATMTTTSPVVSHRFFLYNGASGTGFYGNFSVRLVVFDSDSGFEGMVTELVTIARTGSHDLAVTRLTPVPQTVSQGGTEVLIVEVTNYGDSLETYNLTITYGPSNQTLITLAAFTQRLILSGATNSYSVSLNTAGLSPGQYTVIARVSDTLDTNPANDAMTSHFIIGQQDEPPVASFTLTPSKATAGQTVAFDASASNDPDGTITNYNWMFGDGIIYSNPFPTFHYSYVYPGNYTVTLTVTDSSGLSASATMSITILAAPQHDVQLQYVNAYPSDVITGQMVLFYVGIGSNGTQPSTVDITVYYGRNVAVSAHGLLIHQGYTSFFNFEWTTTGVSPGNYTLSATVFLADDPTPGDNSLTNGQLVIQPLPVITATPASGPVGTTVILHGSGFVPQYYPTSNEYLITFDNQFVGIAYGNMSFTFTFNIPVAQAGLHQIHAIQQSYISIDVQTSFTVTPPPGNLTVIATTGSIYFPGDTVTVFIQTSLNGQSTTPTSIQATLLRPGNTSITLTLTQQTTGLYKTTYTIPSTGPILGTYAVIVKAHQTSANDAQTITSFEVKLSWLANNGKNITAAVAITGLVGVGAVAWRKGYFKRKDEEARDGSISDSFTAI